jgi:hypothetical protein
VQVLKGVQRELGQAENHTQFMYPFAI